MSGSIGPRTETYVNLGGPIAMVPYLHQGNTYVPRKPLVWKDQKCLPLVGTEIPLTCAGQQTTSSREGRYRAKNGNLRKFVWTYRYSTVFAPKKYLYPKEATGMESPEMYFNSRCTNPTYLCMPGNYPISCSLWPKTETCIN